ncbi:MAG TPA: ATP-binding protein [Bacteroidales bacterium]|nr:ATP-binding protein [Bacteroidales bacterium]
MMRRISITGPESTGKSMLAQQLAGRYHTAYVPEAARSYLASLGRSYSYDDLLLIAREQYRLEQEMARKANRYLFCDTDFIVLKIWSIDKFQRCDPWIQEMVLHHRYDLYLLMDTDLSWEPDPQREDPDRREFLFSLYQAELDKLGVDYYIISGMQEERVRNAVRVIPALQ